MRDKTKRIIERKVCSKIMALILVITFSMSFVMPMTVFAVDPTKITVDKTSAYADQIITITVDDTLAVDVEPTGVVVSGAGLGVVPDVALASTGNPDEYRGTFTVPAGLTAGEELSFTYIDSEAVPYTTKVKILQKFALTSAVAIGSGTSSIGNGDQVILSFDMPIKFDGVAPIYGKIELDGILGASVVGKLAGAAYSGAWTATVPAAGYDVLTITFTDGGAATLKNGDAISLAANLVIGNNGGYISDVATTALTGVFGTAIAPEIATITAISTATGSNGSGASKANDVIRVVFNSIVNSSAAGISVSGGSLGTGGGTSWASDTGTSILTITLGEGADIIPGTTTLSVTGVKDGVTNTLDCSNNTNRAIAGSFGAAIKPQVMSVTAISTTGNGVASKDDVIKVVFNTLVTKTEPIVITSPNGYLGNIITQVWSEENETSVLTIGLGSTPNVTPGITTISISGNIKDAASNTQSYDNATFIVRGSFGSVVAPRVVKALAVSATGNGAASQGDMIKVIFNTLVDSSGVTGISVSNGNLGGIGYDEDWRTENGVSVLIIKLGSNPQIKVGTQIDSTKISINGVIRDENTKTKICTNALAVTIDGSFGTGIQPAIVRSTAISTTGIGVASEGDVIKVVFNTLVDSSGVTGITVSAGSTLGIGYSQTWTPSENGVSVLTITLGANPEVVVGETTISIIGTVKDELTKTLVCEDTSDISIVGSFGVVIPPEVMRVTAVSMTGNGVASEGDIIIVTFNTIVDRSEVTLVSTTGDFGTDYMTDWLDIDGVSVLGVILGENPDITVGVTEISIIGDIKDDLTRTVVCANSANMEIGGSFGVTIVPSVISAVAYTGTSNVNLQDEFISIIFNAATNKPTINPNDIKVNGAMNLLGTNANTTWVSDFELLVTLGSGSEVKKGDTLDLSGLGIKAKDAAYFDINISTAVVSGELAVPIVLSAIASDGTPSTDGAAKGDKITITFSSRTNKAANLANLTALLGTGATASWNANGTVLTLTLGNNPTIYDGGFIVLNSLGIKDAFSNSHFVVGQYQVTGFFGPVKEGPKVVKVSASSIDTSKTAIGINDKITIKFNAPTNQFGTKTKADIDKIITLANGKSMGTNYTGEWFNNDTLVITIVNAAGANIVPGVDMMLIGGTGADAIKYASGLYDGSEATNENVLITGSFDGRAFAITNVVFNKTTGKVTATIDKSNLSYQGDVAVVFALYNGSTPVFVNSVKMNIETKVDLESIFAGSSGDTIKVYVFSDFVSDVTVSPAVLANTVTKQ